MLYYISEAYHRTFYNVIKKTFAKISLLKEQTFFVQIKNIDLCQALKGTMFKTQLNQLWDIKQIFSCVEIGFSSLQWDNCDQKAIVVCEENLKAPFKLFCKDHFKELDLYYKSSTNLAKTLNLCVIMLNELEIGLASLQVRIEYFSIKKRQKISCFISKR